ncbi:MAG: twin-arginine translocation signal domain-containing protein, partial [Bacteroidales bacterium]|nr:twin-arginine translocation signal domain-containing protein [Bacteroidales bacterium]
MNTKKPNISRRNFLKKFTVVGATTAATLAGCRDAAKQTIGGTAARGDVPTDKMTYRTSNTGDSVSLLG